MIYTFLLAGSLGVALQILFKIQSLKVRSKTANHPFVCKEYLSDDWPAIAGSFISVGILIICLDELLAVKPGLADYIKWLFVFVGFTGSTIIQAVLSVTSKKLMAVIDVKSNIADGVTPPVDATNIDGAKEILKDDKKLIEETKP